MSDPWTSTLPQPGGSEPWESSGIVDVASVFGPGTFLVTVQEHIVGREGPRDDNVPPAGPDFTFKREGGQLVLSTIPGG